MADASTLSPALSRSVSALARTLVAAARSWAPYPPDHPLVAGARDRLHSAIGDACGGGSFSFGVTPDSRLVTYEHPSDLFRPRAKLVRDRSGAALEDRGLVNTWEADGRGDYTWAVVEAVDPDEAGIDPLQYL